MKYDPKRMAAALQHMGRRGDTLLAHINPREAALLDRVTDGGSINPKTGILEYFDSDVDGDPGNVGSGYGTDNGGNMGNGPGGADSIADAIAGGLASNPGGANYADISYGGFVGSGQSQADAEAAMDAARGGLSTEAQMAQDRAELAGKDPGTYGNYTYDTPGWNDPNYVDAGRASDALELERNAYDLGLSPEQYAAQMAALDSRDRSERANGPQLGRSRFDMGVGSILGGLAGFAVGGPPGAVLGSAAGRTMAGGSIPGAFGSIVGGAVPGIGGLVGGFAGGALGDYIADSHEANGSPSASGGASSGYGDGDDGGNAPLSETPRRGAPVAQMAGGGFSKSKPFSKALYKSGFGGFDMAQALKGHHG